MCTSPESAIPHNLCASSCWPSPPWRSAMRIILVDGDPTRVEACDSLLRRVLPNLDLEHVATQARAIACLAAQAVPRYDLALIGTDSPDVADLTLLTYIREQEIPLAVVLLFGEASPEAAAATLAAGADGYV